jgi:hypothetical protein
MNSVSVHADLSALVFQLLFFYAAALMVLVFSVIVFLLMGLIYGGMLLAIPRRKQPLLGEVTPFVD